MVGFSLHLPSGVLVASTFAHDRNCCVQLIAAENTASNVKKASFCPKIYQTNGSRLSFIFPHSQQSGVKNPAIKFFACAFLHACARLRPHELK
jgi:hypothetical protein